MDGGPRTVMIWAVRAEEVEAVEVYETRIRPYKVGQAPAARPGPARTARLGSGCPVNVYVWLRK